MSSNDSFKGKSMKDIIELAYNARVQLQAEMQRDVIKPFSFEIYKKTKGERDQLKFAKARYKAYKKEQNDLSNKK